MLEPPKWVIDEKGEFEGPRWWESQLSLALFCLKPDIKQVVLSQMKEVNWTPELPTLGVHIRRVYLFSHH